MTRLKLKSFGLLPKFIVENEAAVKQLRFAPGFVVGKTLVEPSMALWTTTLWDSEENMRAYYTSAAHRELMPKLDFYACEAVTAHMDYEQGTLPSWAFVQKQLSTQGRFSTALKSPTLAHQNRHIQPPKITLLTRPIKAKVKS